MLQEFVINIITHVMKKTTYSNIILAYKLKLTKLDNKVIKFLKIIFL